MMNIMCHNVNNDGMTNITCVQCKQGRVVSNGASGGVIQTQEPPTDKQMFSPGMFVNSHGWGRALPMGVGWQKHTFTKG